MAKSTVPIVLTGGIVAVNNWLGNGQGFPRQIPVLVGTAVAAGIGVLIEQIPGAAPLAVGIGWITFMAMMIMPYPRGTASPLANLQKLTGI